MYIPDPAERSARLSMRIAPDALETIREAAIAQQQDITGFVLGAAMDRARGVVLEERALRAGSADAARTDYEYADYEDDLRLGPELAQWAREGRRALNSPNWPVSGDASLNSARQ